MERYIQTDRQSDMAFFSAYAIKIEKQAYQLYQHWKSETFYYFYLQLFFCFVFSIYMQGNGI
jgi:hypothetical protein